MYKKYVFVALGIAGTLAAGFYIAHKNQRIPMVDFDTSLKLASYRKLLSPQWGAVVYKVCKNLYYKNGPRYVPYHEQVLIPRTIHQIWLGSPFPEKYRAYAQSWIENNPGFTYKLWTDKELAIYPMVNRDLYNAAINYGERSDIARYEILYREGGLYVDTDFECIRSFEQLHHYYDFYIGMQPLDTGHIQLGSGLIGAAPGHPLLHAVLKELQDNGHEQERIVLKTGPLFLTKLFCLKAPDLFNPIIALPSTYFYPRGYKDAAEDRDAWLHPESYAIHHWAGSWLSDDAFVKNPNPFALLKPRLFSINRGEF